MGAYVKNVIDNLRSVLGELVEIREGLIRLIIPNLAKYTQGKRLEPRWAPVFYNPLTTTSRDLDTLVVEAYRNIYNPKARLCDLLSATGVRGLRYLVESRVERVTLNDVDERAYKLMKANALLNEVEDRVAIYNLDANLLLNILVRKRQRFDIIDIDPFGTPVPFIDSALRTVKDGGMLSVTATDLAPLLGVKSSACLRKYQALSMNTSFSREIAVRILMGYVCRQAAKYELAIIPAFSYSLSHVIRIHILVKRGATRANESLKRMGYVRYCRNCGYRDLVEEYPIVSSKACPRCPHETSIAGPLWVGSLWDSEFVDEVRQVYRERVYLHNKCLSNLLRTIYRESRAPPLYYSTKELSRILGVREVSPKELVKRLRNRGLFACRTHFDTKGFKTNAALDTINDLVLSIVEGDRRAA